MQFVDDGGWSLCWRSNPAPIYILSVRIAGLCDCRHVWQQRGTLARADGEHRDLSGVDKRDRRCNRYAVEVDPPCHHLVEALGATERNMAGVDCRGDAQALSGHMRGRADTGRCKG